MSDPGNPQDALAAIEALEAKILAALRDFTERVVRLAGEGKIPEEDSRALAEEVQGMVGAVSALGGLASAGVKATAQVAEFLQALQVAQQVRKSDQNGTIN